MRKYEKVCKKLRKWAKKESWKLRKCAKSWENVPKTEKVRKCMRMCAMIAFSKSWIQIWGVKVSPSTAFCFQKYTKGLYFIYHQIFNRMITKTLIFKKIFKNHQNHLKNHQVFYWFHHQIQWNFRHNVTQNHQNVFYFPITKLFYLVTKIIFLFTKSMFLLKTDNVKNRWLTAMMKSHY